MDGEEKDAEDDEEDGEEEQCVELRVCVESYL